MLLVAIVAAALFAPWATGDVAYHRAVYSIWGVMTLVVFALALMILRLGRSSLGELWRATWTAGFLAYMLHLWIGIEEGFGGSLDAVFRTQGYVVAASNFVLAALWAFSAGFAWMRYPALWLHVVTAVLAAISAITASVLFASGPSVVVGLMFVAVLVLAGATRLLFDTPVVPGEITSAFGSQGGTTRDGGDQANASVEPAITVARLVRQFWLDIFGKEVQSAATYSYLWMADQMGHLAIGIILYSSGLFIASYLPGWLFGIELVRPEMVALLVAGGGVCFWETRAYLASVRQSTGLFPLDTKTLRDNAVIATVYMLLGVTVALSYSMDYRLGLPLFIVALVLSVFLAPRWLRQKIIWQRAALPYLFRLADAQHTLNPEVAAELQTLIDGPAPPSSAARQIVIFGPVGSGRTPLAAGIGTEFAFKGRGVRYMTFDALLEVVEELRRQEPPAQRRYSYDPGPINIHYWPWWQSQVLILDDISPVVDTTLKSMPSLDLSALLAEGLGPVAGELAIRHTVWVFGGDRSHGLQDDDDRLLQKIADEIGKFCQGSKPAILVRLSRPSHDIAPKSALSAIEPPLWQKP